MARWHQFDGVADLPLHAFQPRPGGAMALHGGKGGGSSAPPPDPRLVAAQIKSLGVQDKAIEQMMANSNTLMPRQLEQMDFAIATAREAWDQSQEDRGWALGRRQELTGLQNQMIQDAKNFNEGDRRDQLQSQAFADVNTAFANAQGQQQRMLGRAGVTPGSGKALAMANNTSLAQASAMANASHKVSEAARMEGYNLTDRAANTLSGYPSMGMQASGAGAGYGSAGLNAANQGLAGVNSGFGAAGGLAGQMGQNATSMWNAQASYKSQQDQLANQGGDIFGTILGGAVGAMSGGLGTAVGNRLGSSDRRLKQDIVAVGVDEATGLTLYEYAYKEAPHERWRGVMADEVREVMPEAVVNGTDGFDRVNYEMLNIPLVLVKGEW